MNSSLNTYNTNLRVNSKKSVQNNSLIFSIKKVKNQKKWTREEDELLIILAQKFNEKHWKEISKRFLNKNSLQCFSRYKRIRPGIIKGSWKKDEDVKILDMVAKYGKSWSKISKLLGTRNGKQIRDRFINVLDPEIKKGKFTEEEDLALVQLFRSLGPKWATISKFFPNRTADMIKNRFHSSIKKRIPEDIEAGAQITRLIKEKDIVVTNSNFTKFETNEDSYNLLSNKNSSNQSLCNGNLNEMYSSRMDSSYMNSPIRDNNYIDTILSKDCDDFYPLNCNDRFVNFDGEKNVTRNSSSNNNNLQCFQNMGWNFEDFFTV